VNVRGIIGRGGVIPLATMRRIVLHERDPADKAFVACLSTEDVYANLHHIVRNERKKQLRRDFLPEKYSETTRVCLVNTAGTPQQTQAEIRKLLAVTA